MIFPYIPIYIYITYGPKDIKRTSELDDAEYLQYFIVQQWRMFPTFRAWFPKNTKVLALNRHGFPWLSISCNTFPGNGGIPNQSNLQLIAEHVPATMQVYTVAGCDDTMSTRLASTVCCCHVPAVFLKCHEALAPGRSIVQADWFSGHRSSDFVNCRASEVSPVERIILLRLDFNAWKQTTQITLR